MKKKNVSKYFGCMVFDDRVMKASLSSKVYQSLRKTIDEGEQLDSSVADVVAEAMKEWAVSKGATHYTNMTALFLLLQTEALSWNFRVRN